MTNRRILHIQKVAGIAGSENHLLTLLPGLASHDYEPEMLALADGHDRPEAFVERMRRSGVVTRIMRISRDVDVSLLPRLAAAVARGRFGVVHTHLLHADLYGRPAARLAGTRVVSTYHCDDPFHLIRGIRQIDAVTARLCSRIICISCAVRDFVRDRLGVPPDRLDVIYYGLQTPDTVQGPSQLRTSLGIGPDAPLIGIVARLTAQKGHQYLLEAMRTVAERVPSVRLVIVGDGELRQDLERACAKLGLEGRVCFLGYRPDAAQLMREFDIFVLPSLFEGLGMVFLEAMAAAKPIVATRISAIPEIVLDGETGLLVPPRDSAALAEALYELCANPGRGVQLGSRGRERLERVFTVEGMIEATARVYDTVATR